MEIAMPTQNLNRTENRRLIGSRIYTFYIRNDKLLYTLIIIIIFDGGYKKIEMSSQFTHFVFGENNYQ